MRMRCLQIADTWRTDCNNVANIRRMRGERIATMQHSKNKNHTFATQKPPFCTPKTILLHRKNHTFVMRICNIQKTNTLRTFRECILNGLRMRGEYVYTGAINRTPTAADGLPITLRTNCQTLLTVCQNATKHAASFGTPHNNAPTYKHKKRIKFTTEYEKNNTNSKHFHHHFPTLICAKTPFTIEQPILVRHIHTVWRGVHRPNFNHNKRI